MHRHVLDPTATAPTADGVDIAAYDFGGAGPDLLLAHATGFCAAVLAPMAERLVDRFHVVALDLRGHGRSGRPVDGDFDWHGFAGDVLAVVDGLGLAAPLGFGHSCGGAALVLAEEARPGTFRGLYLFEPAMMPWDEPPEPPDERNPFVAGSLRRRQAFASRADALATFSSKPPLARLHPDALAAYVDNGFRADGDDGIRLRCRREDEARIYVSSVTHDAYRRLGEVRCPVVLACGADTDRIGPDFLERYTERLERAEAVVLPRLGHFGPLEDPAAVAGSVGSTLGTTAA